MIIVIDIGNSRIKFGRFDGKALVRQAKLSTPKFSRAGLKKILTNLLRPKKETAVKAIVICSVVPKIGKRLKTYLRDYFPAGIYQVSKDLAVPIRNLYRYPQQVGQDRLVNAFAAKEKYPCPSVVVDFGTALTFDIISRAGSYAGGLIFPGLEISLARLLKTAALLPTRFKLPPRGGKLLARDTASSIAGGIIWGYSCLIDGIVQKVSRRLGSRPFVVATGGMADRIAPYCKKIKRIDLNLTLDGLRLIYESSLQKF
jgi:type III pantothenate kinase